MKPITAFSEEGLKESSRIARTIRHMFVRNMTLLEYFMDVKSAVSADVLENVDAYNKCWGDDGFIPSKALQLFTKKYLTDPRLKRADAIDLTEGAQRLLNSIKFQYLAGNLVAVFENGFSGDIYLCKMRGDNFSLTNVTFTPDTEFMVRSLFDCYGTEGFYLALKTDDCWISIVPENAEGTKGVGVVNVYELRDSLVFKAEAECFDNLQPILELYRG